MAETILTLYVFLIFPLWSTVNFIQFVFNGCLSRYRQTFLQIFSFEPCCRIEVIAQTGCWRQCLLLKLNDFILIIIESFKWFLIFLFPIVDLVLLHLCSLLCIAFLDFTGALFFINWELLSQRFLLWFFHFIDISVHTLILSFNIEFFCC